MILTGSDVTQYSVVEGCGGHTHIATHLHTVTHIHRLCFICNGMKIEELGVLSIHSIHNRNTNKHITFAFWLFKYYLSWYYIGILFAALSSDSYTKAAKCFCLEITQILWIMSNWDESHIIKQLLHV